MSRHSCIDPARSRRRRWSTFADAMLADERTERLLSAPGMKIAGGTSEIQRNVIAERILGLPREPAPDPDAGRRRTPRS